jgi:hypothetical protein
MCARDISPLIEIRTLAIAELLHRVGNGLHSHPEAVETVLNAAMSRRPHMVTDCRSTCSPPAESSRNTS